MMATCEPTPSCQEVWTPLSSCMHMHSTLQTALGACQHTTRKRPSCQEAQSFPGHPSSEDVCHIRQETLPTGSNILAPPLQGLGLGLFRVTGGRACVVKGACPQGGLGAQCKGVHPVPMPLQAPLEMPILHCRCFTPPYAGFGLGIKGGLSCTVGQRGKDKCASLRNNDGVHQDAHANTEMRKRP